MMEESDIRCRINEAIAEGSYISSLNLAKEMDIPEAKVIRNLPGDRVEEVAPVRFREILNDVSRWGKVTMVVKSPTMVGEFKVSLPEGEMGDKYYNLWSEDVTCHIKEEETGSIFFVTQPLMGRESASIQFFDGNGDAMFKIFLPKDKGRMDPGQKRMFEDLKSRM